MRLYDTASRTIRPVPMHERTMTIYVCGVTPYDASHLGHAFVYHVFDVIGRRLQQLGRSIRIARNVTDVDDDMMRVARERHVGYRELAETQVRGLDRALRSIGIRDMDATPWASDHVPLMVEWVRRLERNEFAYAVNGWVYFDIRRDPLYGQLSGLDRAAMIPLSAERGARPDDPRKRDPLDFVLWQPSLADEPHWPSPWSAGRPGWHIECTVLATHELGTPIDIHGGGDDLIFPHHESELAQARGVGPDPFVRHWVHVAPVGYEGAKMSKSLGNLVYVSDLVTRTPAAAVRLMLAGHHYREPWEYDATALADAERRLGRYALAARSLGGVTVKLCADAERRFQDRLDDDLDTAGALAVADGVADELLRRPSVENQGGDDPLSRMLGVLGVSLEP